MRIKAINLTIILLLVSSAALAASDFQFTLDNNGVLDYTLDSVSSPLVYENTLPVNDPVINLIAGKRYGVTVVNYQTHPFQLINKGSNASEDIVLLSQGGENGTLENDLSVDWVDDGSGLIEFTVSDTLIQQLKSDPGVPGYRCAVHTSEMRGDFELYGDGQTIAEPIAEQIPKGNIEIELEVVAQGLTSPLGMDFPDDGSGRAFIYDQTGVIYVVDGGPPEVFFDLSDRLVELGTSGPGSYDERGLLGFALHPLYPEQPFFFTYTSEPVDGFANFTAPLPQGVEPDHQSVINWWTLESTGPDVVDPDSRFEVMRIDQPQFNHNGGIMTFGPDSYLYIALGDGGNADDEGDGHSEYGNAQNIENIYGTILRIDVDTAKRRQYLNPGSNPFRTGPGLAEIYAYGLRNPYGISFDGEILYAVDVGQNKLEEINRVTAGGNYGWRHKEGSFFFDPGQPEVGDGLPTTEPVIPYPDDLIDPVAEYDRSDGKAIVGGFVYNGTAIPELSGLYVFGDFSQNFATPNGRLFYLTPEDEIREFIIGSEDRELDLYVKGFARDLQGNVYVLGSTEVGVSGNTGVVLKLVPSGVQQPTATPTGTMTPSPTVTSTATGTPEFSPTPTQTPGTMDTPTPVAEDINRDGSVDHEDVFLLQRRWLLRQ